MLLGSGFVYWKFHHRSLKDLGSLTPVSTINIDQMHISNEPLNGSTVKQSDQVIKPDQKIL